MAISRHIPIPLRLLMLTALCSTTTTAMPASRIFAREGDSSCSASDLVSCPAVLPDTFCCPEGSSCKALAGGTTAVCCPEGRSCDRIQPITCNVSEQDVEKNPQAPIKTTVFDVDLAKCGSNTCCPFGYTCSSDGKECVMDDDQSEAPKGAGAGTTATTTTTAGPTATSTDSSASSTGTAASTSSSVPGKGVDADKDADKDNGGPATTSIIGGVVGGCLILLAIAVVIFLYIRRSNKKLKNGNSEKGGPRPTSSTGSFGNIISDPIMQPNSYRTDFIRRGSSTMSGSSVPVRTFSTRSHAVAPLPPRIRISIPNPFDSPNPSPVGPASAQPSPNEDDRPPRTGTVAASRLPPIRAMKAQHSHWSRRPETPELQREPSSESINIFADPGTVGSNRQKDMGRRLTHATTFTDLMDEAQLGDVRRGRPYVPGTTPRI